MNLLLLKLNWFNVWNAEIQKAKMQKDPINKETHCLAACVAHMNYMCYHAQLQWGME